MGPLVDVTTLAARLGNPDLVVVDCRFDLTDTDAGGWAYRDAHIPGAVHAHLDEDLSAASGPGRHPLPSPADFGATLGSLGISHDSAVVAYDASGGAFAARMWWMLRALGHRTVAVLDGGWQAWTRSRHPTESGLVDRPEATYVTPGEWSDTIDRERLGTRLGAITLIDARSRERYRGEIEPLDPVAGHIPTAVNLPYAEALDADGGFLEPGALASLLEAGGAGAVVYCGSGVTACHSILAMEVAGLGRATLYPGSWSDWSTAGGPVATGPAPGSAP
jgi:thiosulfate/3-mercaptopyruvate sulfurtransferase